MKKALGTLALILLFSLLSYAAPQSTILWYRFNTGPDGAAVASVIDSGPFKFDAVVTGNLTYDADVPTAGKPFSLNATADADYAVLAQTQANSHYLNQTRSFTLSAYANPTGGTTLDTAGDIIAGKLFSNGSGPCLISYALLYSAVTNKFVAVVCGADGSGQFIASTHTFPFGAWYKVQLKYSTSANGKVTQIKLTVNGKKEGAIKLNSFAGIQLGSAGFQVGAANFEFNDHGTYRRNFIGNIDEVKLTGQLP
jgi:hypothetical protein